MVQCSDDHDDMMTLEDKDNDDKVRSEVEAARRYLARKQCEIYS